MLQNAWDITVLRLLCYVRENSDCDACSYMSCVQIERSHSEQLNMSVNGVAGPNVVSVTYETRDGTAKPKVDFTYTQGTLVGADVTSQLTAVVLKVFLW